MQTLSQMTFMAVLALTLSAGCTTLQTMPAKMKSMVSKAPDPSDPLANVAGKPGADYRTAKKELQSPEETMLKFARWREDLGDHSESLDRYREILRGNPNSIDARLGIARVEFKTGRVHEAEEILKATARQHPDNLAVWLEMGRIQTEREEYGEAVQSLQKAVKIDSSSQAARYQLGLALARGDRLQEAQPHLAFAVGESAALFNIGFVLHEAGRNEESAHWLQQALDAHPDQRTQQSAQQVLALVRSGRSAADVAAASAKSTQPPKVDLQLTSYEAWSENPARPSTQPHPAPPIGPGTLGPGTLSPGSIGGHAGDVGSAPGVRFGTPQTTGFAAAQRPAAGTQISSRPVPRFYGDTAPSTGPAKWPSATTPVSFERSAVLTPSQVNPVSAGHSGSVEPKLWQPQG